MQRRALGSEAGVTLVEVLAAVSLMGIAFVMIIGGMMTASIGADIHRKAATVDLELRTFADRAVAATYVDCASASSYSPAAISYDAPPGFSATVQSVTFWQPSGSDPSTGSFVSGCSTDPGLQRLTLRMAATDGRAQDTREVLKRKP